MKATEINAIVFDTETTGFEEPEIVEAAWVAAGHEQTDWYCERFAPDKPITYGAMAIHGILQAELLDCRHHGEFRLPDGLQYLIGHNVDFDWEVAGKPQVKRICTLALSRWLYPDKEGHNLSAMMFRIYDPVTARNKVRNAHGAFADVHMTKDLLHHLIGCIQERGIRCDSWDDLWELSEEARIPKVWSFGKHVGTAIADTPIDYVMWFWKQKDVDPYLRVALGRLLGRT